MLINILCVYLALYIRVGLILGAAQLAEFPLFYKYAFCESLVPILRW
jgi:hypothetical protein